MNTIASAALAPVADLVAPVATAKWTVSQVEALYQLPLMDLLFRAQQVHRENFNPNEVQRSTLRKFDACRPTTQGQRSR